ncbi:hypothetical protein CSX00_09740 [Pseudobutyrivibrio ruminis]|uniref:Uncharacterized protein n=1 Tax=Pseudobutyrivibrio ruminis TaxID=46206 RepID=A0A2G3E8G6_9FIRM|nr:hypothetical protein CSX00_09740 [Pseudobutyrivibrio ruminis]
MVRWTISPLNRPTQALCAEETLNPGFKELIGAIKKSSQVWLLANLHFLKNKKATKYLVALFNRAEGGT